MPTLRDTLETIGGALVVLVFAAAVLGALLRDEIPTWLWFIVIQP